MFSFLLTWPLTPVRGVLWLAEQIRQEAEADLTRQEITVSRLADLDEAVRSGDLTLERYAALVAELKDGPEPELPAGPDPEREKG